MKASDYSVGDVVVVQRRYHPPTVATVITKPSWIKSRFTPSRDKKDCRFVVGGVDVTASIPVSWRQTLDGRDALMRCESHFIPRRGADSSKAGSFFLATGREIVSKHESIQAAIDFLVADEAERDAAFQREQEARKAAEDERKAKEERTRNRLSAALGNELSLSPYSGGLPSSYSPERVADMIEIALRRDRAARNQERGEVQ